MRSLLGGARVALTRRGIPSPRPSETLPRLLPIITSTPIISSSFPLIHPSLLNSPRRRYLTPSASPPNSFAQHRDAAEERSRLHERNEDDLQTQALLPKQLSWKAVSRALAGNAVIATMKFGVFLQTGSAGMLSEAIHTLADAGNQALLLKGLNQASQTPDKRYQYGYGKASFFWALVSALGMFWTGAGVSLGHGVYTLMHPPEALEVSREMIAVLAGSFLVDGFVLVTTLRDVMRTKPAQVGYYKHLTKIRDPFVLAVLFEDAAACTGVALCATGIVLTQHYNDVSFDTLAGISVGLLLVSVAGRLVSINRSFLLGQAVDDEIVQDIRQLLKNRPAISAVHDVQSQWIGPSAFAFKAECDFNGQEIAKRLEELYIPLFITAVDARGHDQVESIESTFTTDVGDESDPHHQPTVEIVMAWMAEDVTRLIEQEVKEVETLIRIKHPQAAFIELEPDSKKSFLRASDGKVWSTRPTSPLLLSARRAMSARISTKRE